MQHIFIVNIDGKEIDMSVMQKRRERDNNRRVGKKLRGIFWIPAGENRVSGTSWTSEGGIRDVL